MITDRLFLKSSDRHFGDTTRIQVLAGVLALTLVLLCMHIGSAASRKSPPKLNWISIRTSQHPSTPSSNKSAAVQASDEAAKMIEEGKQIFRFETFGDEAFWGDTLRLHEAVATLSPAQALELGLKVDSDALPANVIQ